MVAELIKRVVRTRSPLTCRLDRGSGAARLAEWSRLVADGLVAEARDDGVITTVWRNDGDVPARLRALIAAEADCCPFLTFSLEEIEEGIRVRMIFPPDAEPLMNDFVRQIAA